MNITLSANLYSKIRETIDSDIKIFDTVVQEDEKLPFCVFQDISDEFVRYFNDKRYNYIYQITIAGKIEDGIVYVRNEFDKLQNLDLQTISDGTNDLTISVESSVNNIDNTYVNYILSITIK